MTTTDMPPKTRPRRFDLVAFDWDGTLFDSTRLIARCIQAACADVGTTVPSDRDASFVIGLGLADALRHAAPELSRERYPQLAERYRYHYVASKNDIVLFEGTLELLHALKARNVRIAVATGKNRRGLDEALQASLLRGLFDATRTADETRGKPDPLMLRELMSELGTGADRTLMIGDTTHDLQLAANAGCASVAVSFGAHDHAEFARHRPLHVAHSTADLAAWLEAHG
ncbi:MAG: HAD-IA family hydrolase [Caldimonas sp.]